MGNGSGTSTSLIEVTEGRRGSYRDPKTGVTVAARLLGAPGEGMFVCTYVPSGRPRGGVVICPSLHAELLSNYRAEVLLAQHLAAAGVAVLRLHYRGTGQSEGDEDAVTFDSMRDDIVSAAQSFEDSVKPGPLAYVGARFGAVLGAAAASPRSPLVLWEPVFDGRRYWRDVSRSRMIHKMNESEDPGSEQADMLKTLDSGKAFDALGYRIHPALFESTVPRALQQEMLAQRGPVLLVQLSRQADLRAPHRAFVDQMRAQGLDVDVELVPDEPVWWLLRPPMKGMERLIDMTTRWLVGHLGGEEA